MFKRLETADLPERCLINICVEVVIDEVQRSFLLEKEPRYNQSVTVEHFNGSVTNRS